MMTSFITEKGTRHSLFRLSKGCVVTRFSPITGVNPSVAESWGSRTNSDHSVEGMNRGHNCS